ncbi:hypothetical protein [uncultured Chryseobacterium sp.]|jgi:hypothetical protein|uniref:hypothetical protein n=1 Tax=uncultured Chryseobacterium sp. TaxID=259322 RepID=UPI00260C0EB0|nr:hypothetical protein [uncultured Chryseobacterium sp.]
MSKKLGLGLLLLTMLFNYFLKYFYPSLSVELNYVTAALLVAISTILLISTKKKVNIFFSMGMVLTFLLFFIFVYYMA